METPFDVALNSRQAIRFCISIGAMLMIAILVSYGMSTLPISHTAVTVGLITMGASGIYLMWWADRSMPHWYDLTPESILALHIRVLKNNPQITRAALRDVLWSAAIGRIAIYGVIIGISDGLVRIGRAYDSVAFFFFATVCALLFSAQLISMASVASRIPEIASNPLLIPSNMARLRTFTAGAALIGLNMWLLVFCREALHL